jgi:hypothetical protein
MGLISVALLQSKCRKTNPLKEYKCLKKKIQNINLFKNKPLG